MREERFRPRRFFSSAAFASLVVVADEHLVAQIDRVQVRQVCSSPLVSPTLHNDALDEPQRPLLHHHVVEFRQICVGPSQLLYLSAAARDRR